MWTVVYIDKRGLLQVYSQHFEWLEPRVNKRFSFVDPWLKLLRVLTVYL